MMELDGARTVCYDFYFRETFCTNDPYSYQKKKKKEK